MDVEAIYKVGLLVVSGGGMVGGGIWLSVQHHLGRGLKLEEWIPAIILLPLLAGMAWPIVFLTPLVGLGYLAHRGIGLVVKPKAPTPWHVFPDPDVVAAEREVEEICSETTS